MFYGRLNGKCRIKIRQINPDEWQLLRQVRLAAVIDSPHAFADSPEETEKMPDSLWKRRTQSGAEGKDSFCVLAFTDSTPAGIAVGLADAEDPGRTYLVSMWVAPQHRGTTIALSLLQKIVVWAKSLKAQVLLAGVEAGNDRAATFYRKSGFETYHGVKPQHPATSNCAQLLSKKLR